MKFSIFLYFVLYLTFSYAKEEENNKYKKIESFLLNTHSLYYLKNNNNSKKDLKNYMSFINFTYVNHKNEIRKKRNQFFNGKDYNIYLNKKMQSINLDINSNLKILNYLTLVSKTHFEFTKNNYLTKIDYRKIWKSYYNFDYTVGQSFGKSINEKTDYKYFMKIDKRLNDKYSFHNYYEYITQGRDSLNSIFSLKKRFNSYESLIYKIILKDNEDYSSYGIKIGYKITNFIL